MNINIIIILHSNVNILMLLYISTVMALKKRQRWEG